MWSGGAIMPTLKILVNGNMRLCEYYHRSQAEKLANGILLHMPELSKLGRITVLTESENITQLLIWNDKQGKQNYAVHDAS